ncbi:MAG: sensor histidine kinase [Gammaproteobacteria bacterium]
MGSHLSSVRDQLEKGDVAGARSTLDEVLPIVREAADLHRDAMSEEAMLRVLGSVGLQTSSVVHELGGLATTSSDLAELVATIRNDRTVDAHARRRLAPLEKSLRDLQHAVERQAAYLIDVVSAEARRRRSRQPLAERFDAAVRLIAHLADQRRITIVNDLPATLRTPPMFPAEVTSVFANLLTNAVKAAGDGGSIRVHGGVREGVLAVRLENTGAVVDLADAERWFDPFESTTVEVHPVLGQGMGLGLTITRRILEEYRASIAFAEPSPGFTTAVEIRFPT